MKNLSKIETLEKEALRILKKKKKTLSTAESCTGGLISSRMTDISGASSYFIGGVVAYSNEVKANILLVPKEEIKKYGAVSSQVAKAMAQGAKDFFGSDIALSITGVAGPSGGSKAKPVGLAYISVISGKKIKTKKVLFKGNRIELKNKFSDAALKLVLENV